ncbi:hypothetical protein [Streptomyces sp. NPDC052107]
MRQTAVPPCAGAAGGRGEETRYGREDPTDYGYGPEQWDDDYDEEQQ